MRFARTRRGQLELASVTLRDRAGHDVVLHGMIHIADRAFYDSVAAELDAAEERGATVLYEGVGSKGDPEPGRESDLVGGFDGLNGAYTSLAQLLGLAIQHKDALPIRDSWINTDYDRTRLVRELPDAERFITEMEKAHAEITKLEGSEDAVRTVLQHLPLLTRLAGIKDVFSPYRRRTNGVISKNRSAFGTDAILAARAEGGSEIHALWGAAHLDDMVGLLTPRGYRQVATTWRVAIADPVAHEQGCKHAAA